MSHDTGNSRAAAPAGSAGSAGSAGRSAISTPAVPQARARFSAGVRVGNVVQVAGQGPLDAATGEVLHAGDVGAQTTATLEAVKAVLEAGGASISDVVMFRVYITDASFFGAMNDAYNAFMDEHFTHDVLATRTTAVVGLVLPDMLVEIDALAVLDEN